MCFGTTNCAFRFAAMNCESIVFRLMTTEYLPAALIDATFVCGGRGRRRRRGEERGQRRSEAGGCGEPGEPASGACLTSHRAILSCPGGGWRRGCPATFPAVVTMNLPCLSRDSDSIREIRQDL